MMSSVSLTKTSRETLLILSEEFIGPLSFEALPLENGFCSTLFEVFGGCSGYSSSNGKGEGVVLDASNKYCGMRQV